MTIARQEFYRGLELRKYLGSEKFEEWLQYLVQSNLVSADTESKTISITKLGEGFIEFMSKFGMPVKPL